MAVHQAFRFELDRLHARQALCVLAMRQGAGLGEARAWAAETTGPVPWTLYSLRREWNLVKDEIAPWWEENSKEAYNSGLDALARALNGYFDSRGGARAGVPVGS